MIQRLKSSTVPGYLLHKFPKDPICKVRSARLGDFLENAVQPVRLNNLCGVARVFKTGVCVRRISHLPKDSSQSCVIRSIDVSVENPSLSFLNFRCSLDGLT